MAAGMDFLCEGIADSDIAVAAVIMDYDIVLVIGVIRRFKVAQETTVRIWYACMLFVLSVPVVTAGFSEAPLSASYRTCLLEA